MLKPQDLLVLLYLASKRDPSWEYRSVSCDLKIGLGEVHRCIHRSHLAGLYDIDSKAPNRRYLREFIVHGAKFCFAEQLGATTRGVPTCKASPFKSPFKNDGIEIPVWPSAQGPVRGLSLKPLYPSVPKIAADQKQLYQLLVLFDFIRIGRQRERAWASDRMEAFLQ